MFLHEGPWSGTVFIFMNRKHTQLRFFIMSVMAS